MNQQHNFDKIAAILVTILGAALLDPKRQKEIFHEITSGYARMLPEFAPELLADIRAILEADETSRLQSIMEKGN